MTTYLAGTGPRMMTSAQSTWVKQQIFEFLKRANDNLDDVVVISGMALNFDTMWAQTALDLKIPLHAYIPADTQTGWKKTETGWFKFTKRAWNVNARDQWERLLKKADKVVDCKETFPPTNWGTIGALMTHRSRCMVNACTYLCGAWGGKRGGTSGCLEYALALNRRTYLMDITKKTSAWDSLPLDDVGNLIVGRD